MKTDRHETTQHDVGGTLQRASRAAQRGDDAALEAALAELRALRFRRFAALSTRLRGIARSVRTHPAFDPPVD